VSEIRHTYKVLLVNPPVATGGYESKECSIPPVGIGYLASYLIQNGISCEIVDGKLEGLTVDEVAVRCTGSGADLVGISAMTPDIVAAGLIAGRIKESSPQTPVVLGGAHAIARPRETLAEFPQFDFLATGEGEQTLHELVGALSNGGHVDSIAGLAYRQNGSIVVNAPRDYILDLDRLPYPAWHLFPQKTRTFAVVSARGCPYHCAFCMRALGQRVRDRSPESVVDEIAFMVERFGADHILFRDETFTVHKKRVMQITGLLISRGLHKKIRWTAQTRADCASAEVFASMKEAGCDTIEFGVESGNQETLDRVSKGIKLEQVEGAVRLARKCGLRVACTFILGHPFETEATVQQTIDFAVRLKPTFLSFGIMSPYPGTAIWKMAQAGEGNYRLLSCDWESFVRFGGGCLELTDISRRRLAVLQVMAYAQFYLRTYNILGLMRYGFPRWRQALAMLRNVFLRERK